MAIMRYNFPLLRDMEVIEKPICSVTHPLTVNDDYITEMNVRLYVIFGSRSFILFSLSFNSSIFFVF